MPKADTKRAESVRSLIASGATTAQIVRATGASRGLVSHYRRQGKSPVPETPGDEGVTALAMLRGKAKEGNVSAILKLQELENVSPCVNHMDKAVHDNEVSEIYETMAGQVMAIGNLVIFDELKPELTSELRRCVEGIKATVEARWQVRDNLQATFGRYGKPK